MLALRVGAFVPPGRRGRRAGADRGGPARGEDRELHQVGHARCARSRSTGTRRRSWRRGSRRRGARSTRWGSSSGARRRSSGGDREPLELQLVQEEVERVRPEGGVRRHAALRPAPHVRDHQPRPPGGGGENIKTVSALLGHADASYTLDLYVGFIPATTRGLADRYVGRLRPGTRGRRGKSMDLRRISGDKAARYAILSFA